jgi:hypothetical protein
MIGDNIPDISKITSPVGFGTGRQINQPAIQKPAPQQEKELVLPAVKFIGNPVPSKK